MPGSLPPSCSLRSAACSAAALAHNRRPCPPPLQPLQPPSTMSADGSDQQPASWADEPELEPAAPAAPAAAGRGRGRGQALPPRVLPERPERPDDFETRLLLDKLHESRQSTAMGGAYSWRRARRH